MRALKWFGGLLVAGLSGLLASLTLWPSWVMVELAGSTRPPDLGLLAWLAFVPGMVAIGVSRSHKTAAARGYAFAFCWFLFGCHFVGAPHPVAWYVSFPIYGVYGAMLALILWRLKRLAPGWMPLTWAAVWVAGDWLWAVTGVKFPWLVVGYSQLDSDILYMQTADLFGVWGTTFGIIAVNALLARMLIDRFGGWREQLRTLRTQLPKVEVPAEAKAEPLTKVVRDVPANSWRAVWRHHRRHVMVTAALLLAAHIYGLVQLELVKDQPGPVMALMQPNVPLAVGRDHENAATQRRMQQLIEAVDESQEPGETVLESDHFLRTDAKNHYPFVRDRVWIQRTTPDPVELLVWPETVYSWGYHAVQHEATTHSGEAITRRYLEIPQRNGWYVQLSTIEYEEGADYDGVPIDEWYDTFGTRNVSLLLAPDGSVVEEYNKIELVPVGEYVPFYEYTDFFYNITEQIYGGTPPNHTPGTEATTFEIPVRGEPGEVYRYGVAICFESNFPDLCRRFTANGAKLLLVQSNDAWFMPSELDEPPSAEPWQIWLGARTRAIESRVGVVRCVNSGVSGVVGPDGRFREVFEVETEPGKIEAMGVPGVLITRVPTGPGASLYVLIGDVFPIVCLGVGGLLLLITFFRRLHSPFEQGLSTAMVDETVATAEPVTRKATSLLRGRGDADDSDDDNDGPSGSRSSGSGLNLPPVPPSPASGGVSVPFTETPPDKPAN